MPDNQVRILPRQRPTSRRDAATLTEDSKGLHRVLDHVEVTTLSPEEDEEQSVLSRHHDRLGMPVDQESDEEEYFKEELELMESKRHRHTGVEANYEKRRSNKTDGRYMRELVHCFVHLYVDV